MKQHRIVCLCGSTRFWKEFQKQSLRLTLEGHIVLSIGCASGTDDDHFGNLPREEYDRVKADLDALHKKKIDLADEILVLNVGDYIGESTRGEIEHARAIGCPIRYLEPHGGAIPVSAVVSNPPGQIEWGDEFETSFNEQPISIPFKRGWIKGRPENTCFLIEKFDNGTCLLSSSFIPDQQEGLCDLTEENAKNLAESFLALWAADVGMWLRRPAQVPLLVKGGEQ